MLNKNITAARAIKGELIPVEASIDVALGQLGMLISTACRARLDAGLPAHIGQEALSDLTAATAMMAELRARVIAAHRSLAQDGRSILPVGLGDMSDCPAQGRAVGSEQMSATLRAVS